MELDQDTTIRNSADLLQAVPDSEFDSNSPGAKPSTEFGMSTVRQEIEGDVHFLLHSDKPAILLARDWHVIGMPHSFENLDLYREAAERSNCILETITRPEAGGLERLLFMAKVKGLSDEEYLECIEGPIG